MRVVGVTMRVAVTAGVASLVAGCVEPAYYQPGLQSGPVQLQGYPPPVTYRSSPDYRPPVGGPIPLQPPPVIQPLPPASPVLPPSATEVPDSDLGPIPVQDMPSPTSDAPADPAPSQATDPVPTPTQVAAPEVVRKTPTSGPGNNVPLEGFRPMKGQTRPAP